MEDLQPVIPLIASRIQRLRERMFIEQVSGISPSDRDLFLSLCHRYEQKVPLDKTSLNLFENDEWMKWDDDWGDWFKLMRALDTNTQVL